MTRNTFREEFQKFDTTYNLVKNSLGMYLFTEHPLLKKDRSELKDTNT